MKCMLSDNLNSNKPLPFKDKLHLWGQASLEPNYLQEESEGHFGAR